MRALTKDPAARYQSAHEMIAALREVSPDPATVRIDRLAGVPSGALPSLDTSSDLDLPTRANRPSAPPLPPAPPPAEAVRRRPRCRSSRARRPACPPRLPSRAWTCKGPPRRPPGAIAT